MIHFFNAVFCDIYSKAVGKTQISGKDRIPDCSGKELYQVRKMNV